MMPKVACVRVRCADDRIEDIRVHCHDTDTEDVIRQHVKRYRPDGEILSIEIKTDWGYGR